MEMRQENRFSFVRKVKWDFFTGAEGAKSGFITDISKSGCLLKSCKSIHTRRWLRILVPIHEESSNVQILFSLVGRIVRREDKLESVHDTEFTLYRYGIQFTQPTYLNFQEDLIFALATKNSNVLSCLNRKTKSSLRPGFLA